MKSTVFSCDLCSAKVEGSDESDDVPSPWQSFALVGKDWVIHICPNCVMFYGRPEQLETKEGGVSLLTAFLKNKWRRT